MSTWIARLLDDGFVIPLSARWSEQPTDAPPCTIIRVQGLEHAYQFFRVQLESAAGSDVVVILSARGETDEALSRTRALISPHLGQALALIREDHDGFACTWSEATELDEHVAAATALVRMSCSWDESPSIRVLVGARSFDVTGEFSDGAWRMSVREPAFD